MLSPLKEPTGAGEGREQGWGQGCVPWQGWGDIIPVPSRGSLGGRRAGAVTELLVLQLRPEVGAAGRLSLGGRSGEKRCRETEIRDCCQKRRG